MLAVALGSDDGVALCVALFRLTSIGFEVDGFGNYYWSSEIGSIVGHGKFERVSVEYYYLI